MDDAQEHIGATLTIHHGQGNALMFRDFGSAGMHVAIFGHHDTTAVMVEPDDMGRLMEYLCGLPCSSPTLLTKYAADLCEREAVAGFVLKRDERQVLREAAMLLRHVAASKTPKKKHESVTQRALNR